MNADNYRSIDRLVGILQTHVKKAPASIVRREIICAAQYLAKTCALTFDLKLTTQDCLSDYHFDHLIPEHHRVIGTLVKYCGECIDPIDKCAPCPSGYEPCSDTHIKIYPEPSGGQEIELCLTIEPTEECCELSRVFTENLSKQVIEKARGELLMYDDVPWENHNKGRWHLQRAQGYRTSEAVAESRGHDRRACINEGSPVV